ncbi:hypothetical protein ScPMuIL_014897 [Solemya velum]
MAVQGWKNIVKKTIINKVQETLSFRKALFSSEGHGKLKLGMRCGRFGPFSEQFVDDLNANLFPLLPTSEQRKVPDVYTPEVLLQIISKTEDVNRLLAEMVLVQYSTSY